METVIKVFALGGLGEVGKNMYVVSVNGEMIVIDAGIIFPDSGYGVDYIINDPTFLKENKDRIKGIFITHGHEDHIGGLPYLLRELSGITLYTSGITTYLVTNKMAEYPLIEFNIKEFSDKSVFKFDNFDISFFRTTHSVPDSFGIAIKTKLGLIIHTGDFKFDLTPIGKPTDFDKLVQYGKDKVLLLLSDSTNAFVSKSSPSEKEIGANMNTLFSQIKGRIIISTFSSNIYRVSQIVKAAKDTGRRVIIYGRSMEKAVKAGVACGYIEDDGKTFITQNEYPSIPKDKIVVICTGSQGEPLAALARIAEGTHKYIKVDSSDTIIFSSSVIPGNTDGIKLIVNKLFKIGANVIVNSPFLDTHTSGHASVDELKLMLSLLKPKYFMPIHGEVAMLKRHTELAHEVGIPSKNCFVMENGDVLEITKDGASIANKIDVKNNYIDSNNEFISPSLIKERRMMSEDGILVVTILEDEAHKVIDVLLDIIGFIIPRNAKGIINSLKIRAKERYEIYVSGVKRYIDSYVRAVINNEIQKQLEDLTGRRVMVITSIVRTK